MQKINHFSFICFENYVSISFRFFFITLLIHLVSHSLSMHVKSHKIDPRIQPHVFDKLKIYLWIIMQNKSIWAKNVWDSQCNALSPKNNRNHILNTIRSKNTFMNIHTKKKLKMLLWTKDKKAERIIVISAIYVS